MNKNIILVSGDILTIALLTLAGFASHGEADLAFLPRMAATFFPVSAAWFLLAPWFGLLDEEVVVNVRSVLRVPLAMTFVAPLAAILRAAVLGSAALPIFVLVLGSTFALGILIWRAAYAYFARLSKS